MSATPELDLLTMREVAKLLKVSEVTVARWLKQGRLPAYRVGPRAVRVRRADVERLMEPVEVVERAQQSETDEDWKAQALKPLTEEEKEYAMRWMEEAIELSNAISARRGGKPFSLPTEEIIRREREKRTRQIDEAIWGRRRRRNPSESVSDSTQKGRD